MKHTHARACRGHDGQFHISLGHECGNARIDVGAAVIRN